MVTADLGRYFQMGLSNAFLDWKEFAHMNSSFNQVLSKCHFHSGIIFNSVGRQCSTLTLQGEGYVESVRDL